MPLPVIDMRSLAAVGVGGTDVGLQVRLPDHEAQAIYGSAGGWYTVATFAGGDFGTEVEGEFDRDESGQNTGRYYVSSDGWVLTNRIKESDDLTLSLFQAYLSVTPHDYRYSFPFGFKNFGTTVAPNFQKAHQLYGLYRGLAKPGYKLPTSGGTKREWEVEIRGDDHVHATVHLENETTWPVQLRDFTDNGDLVVTQGLLGSWRADSVTGYADGEPFDTWVGSRNVNRHLQQTVQSKRPAYRESVAGLGGRPGIEFDGIDDFMAATSVPAGWSADDLGYYVVGIFASTGGSQYVIYTAHGVDTTDLLIASWGDVRLGIDASSSADTAWRSFQAGNRIYAARRNGSDLSLREAVAGVEGTQTGVTKSLPAVTGFQIGGLGNGHCMQATIAEVLWYAGPHTQTQADSVIAYLKKRYDL